MTYPEHDKMAAKRDDIDTVTAFLEWLGSQGYRVLRADDERPWSMDYADWPGHERLLAEHFEIDPKKLSAEKDEMYRALLAMNAAREETPT